jgi:hypothetical protein
MFTQLKARFKARFIVPVFAVLCLPLATGCGRVTTPGGNGSSRDANEATTTTQQGSAMTTAGTTVVITTDHSVYAPDGTVQVSVSNHLSGSIFAQDTQASCSILGLQERQGSEWRAASVARCPLGRLAKTIEIAPGATYTAAITTGYSGLSSAVFPTGIYRLVLSYSTCGGSPIANVLLGVVGPVTTIYSAEWSVQ